MEMKGITAPQLCEIVGIKLQRFETLRRRHRERIQTVEATASHVSLDELQTFPVHDDFGGAWNRYNYHDVIALAVTLFFEKHGMAFAAASRYGWNAAGEVLRGPDHDGDHWVGRQIYADYDGMLAEPMVAGSLADVIRPEMTDPFFSIIVCNASALERDIREKVEAAGFKIDGEEIVRTEA
jgi:hypothetical protein